MSKVICNVRGRGQPVPIVGHGGKNCILDHREDFVEWANNNDVEAVFCGHTHRTDGYENRDLSNIDDDYTWDSEGTRLFNEKPYYIETESSTDA